MVHRWTMNLISGVKLGQKAYVPTVVGLVVLAWTVGAFASQGPLTREPLQGEQSGPAVDADAVDPEDASHSEPTDESAPVTDDGPRDVVGIPEGNPVYESTTGDAECARGETAVRTTPSGKRVRVPCDSVEPGPPGFSQGHEAGNNSVGSGDRPKNPGNGRGAD